MRILLCPPGEMIRHLFAHRIPVLFQTKRICRQIGSSRAQGRLLLRFSGMA